MERLMAYCGLHRNTELKLNFEPVLKVQGCIWLFFFQNALVIAKNKYCGKECKDSPFNQTASTVGSRDHSDLCLVSWFLTQFSICPGFSFVNSE